MSVADASVTPIEAEYAAVFARVTEQRERAEQVRALAEQLEENASRDERLLVELAALIGRDAQLRLEDLDQRLRGQRLREVALEILSREVGPGAPIHYKDWYGLLLAAGHKVGGRNPVATFLAQVHRCERVESIGQRTGRFQLAAQPEAQAELAATKTLAKSSPCSAVL
jgi:hypothetical protein